MERMEAVKPARGDPHGSKTRRRAPPSQATTAVEGKGPEPLTSDRPGLRPTFCPREEQPLTPMAPQSSGAQGLQFQGSSVLESKVRALKEKMASKRVAEPRPISHEQSSSKRLECHQVRAGALRGDRPLPEAAVVPCAERLTDQRPGSSVSEDRGSRSPRLPSPGPDRWNGQSPRPPEAEWTPPDHGKDSPLGPGCSQDSPVHQVTAGGPQGPWKPPRMPRLQERRPCPLRDALDSPALTSEEDVGPGSALLRALWRTGHQGPLDTEDDVLSLSDRVERNRLLLKEMLKNSRQNPPEVGSPTGTPSWDRAALERPAGDVDWDSGTPLQDSGQSRTFAPKPEPVPSARHEEAKHLLQRARMKARTQPLRASHDIVPTIVQGNRNGQRNPAPDARMTSPCRDSPQNGNLSDSSSGESSSGQWPKRDLPLSHVRFEDESVCEAEFRYLQRLQQRQRPVLSTVLQAVGQGPLRSKPDLTHYINRDARDGAFHRPLGSLDHSSDPAPPPTWDSERKCQACGNCLEKPRSAEGRSADLRTLQDLQAAYGAVLLEPCSSCGLSLEFPFLLPEPELHTEWAGETHIRDPVVTCPKEGSSALDSTSTSDSCWMDSEEAGTCRPSKPGRRAQSSSLQQQQQDARPHGGHGWSRTAVMEQLQGLHDCPHLVGADVMVLGEEEKGDIRHMSQKTRFPSRDVPKLPTVEPEEPPLGSRGQPGPGLNSHQAHPGDSWAPRSTASTVTSSMELGPSGSGRLDQFTDCRKSLETACTSSLQPNHTELSTPHPALQPASPVSSEHWMPTPLSSRKSPCPVPPKKPARTGRRRQELQAEPVDALLPCSSPRTTALSPPQAHPCSPPVKPRRLDQPTNSCSKHAPLGLKEPQGAAAHEGMLEREPCYQEPGRPPKSHEDGTFQVAPGSADLTTVNFAAITVSLTSEEPESTWEPVGGRQREESSSGGHTPPGAPPVAHAGPRPPSDGNKKRNNSIVSTLGLKKLFSALGHTSQTKLGTPRSFSVEQLQSAAPASHTSTHKVKRAPSLQSLRLVSPSHQHRKATSFQNLHSLLSGKGDRSSLYLVEGSGKPTASGRPARAPPRRALSVEDVSAPSLARTVGRVVEVFPDGTSQLQLQRPPEGTFGFCVAYGNGHRDSGLYVQAMANRDTAKLYSGLLGVGDEILEVNGAKVAGLSLAHIKELLAHMESLSIRVLRQRVIAQ